MSRLSRWLLVASFGCALVAGALALRPTDACATTGGCFVPSFAASVYLDSVGSDIVSNLSPNLGRCHEQCQELFRGCRDVTKAAEKCIFGAEGADSDAEKHGCNDLSGSAVGSCQQAVKSGEQDFREFVKNDKRSAEGTCQSALGSCTSSCGNGFPE
jgi:hypothetical protein